MIDSSNPRNNSVEQEHSLFRPSLGDLGDVESGTMMISHHNCMISQIFNLT
jgi:hypothetical protein